MIDSNGTMSRPGPLDGLAGRGTGQADWLGRPAADRPAGPTGWAGRLQTDRVHTDRVHTDRVQTDRVQTDRGPTDRGAGRAALTPVIHAELWRS